MKIELTDGQIEYLRILIYSDIKNRGDHAIHAVAYGQDYNDPGLDLAHEIAEKLNNSQ